MPIYWRVNRRINKMNKNKDDILWGDDDTELLKHDEPHGVFEEMIDDLEPDEVKPSNTLTAYEYKRMEVVGDAKDLVELILERWDEEYGNPDGDIDPPTEKMIEAAEQFFKVMKEEYVPWAMEQTGKKETVDVYEWCKENAPEWLEEIENDRKRV
jgi:hypothetical protein